MIEVRHLTKRYDATLAVNDLSFTVDSGEICGLLGPNGAGKSTTMNIMTGCLAATAGTVSYDGHEIYEEKELVKRSIGYLPEQPPLYVDMTVEEYLAFVGRAKGLGRAGIWDEVQRAGEECGLTEVWSRLIKSLSKGYKQRVGIAQALMGDPATVILDEPTVGLDPIQIIEIRDMVRRLRERHTVIVSSHILSEIRTLCDHVIIISHGSVVADDTPEGLERLFAGSSVTRVVARATAEDVSWALRSLNGVASIEFAEPPEEGLVEAHVEAQEGVDIREGVFRALASGNVSVLEMSTSAATLEDVFVELAGDGAGEAETFANADDGEDEEEGGDESC